MKTRMTEPEMVWQYFQRKPAGCFVEVGANDPHELSQTWFLESQGWRGILVEPLPHLAARLREARPSARVIEAACGPHGHPPEVEFHEAEASGHSGLRRNTIDARERYVAVHRVRMMSLDEILAECGHPAVDFLSIDVEGMELEVLRGLDLGRHPPSLILIEDHLFHLQTHRYLQGQGYRLVKRTGLNNWYVPRDRPFGMVTALERIKLWRKVWLGTPWRAFKHRREMMRRGGSSGG